MKKLVFMFVAIAAMSFASCNNKSTKQLLLQILIQFRLTALQLIAPIQLLLIPLLLIPLLLTLSNYSTN